MKAVYTDEMIQWLKNNSWGNSNKNITKAFNEHFNVSYKEGAISYIRNKLGIENGVKPKVDTWGIYREKKYTKEMEEWIRANCYHKFDFEVIKEFNEHFHVNYTVESLHAYKKDHHILSHVIETKRKPHETNSGWFRKGHIPHNNYPVGTEVINKADNQVWRKIAQPNVWKQVSWIIWEEATGQKVPEGYCIIMLDKDQTNLKIENLMLVKRGEMGLINIHNQRSTDPDITKAYVLLNRIAKKMKEKK